MRAPRSSRCSVRLAFCAFALLASAVAFAPGAQAETRSVRIARTAESPVIDGRLDDAVWEVAAPLGALVQVEPEEGSAPSERTDVRIATDGETLFVAFRCYDSSPEDIVALELARDALLGEGDVVNVLLSPFHDRRSGFMFQVNPNGARRDSLVEDQRQNVDWDGIWQAKARIDREGWTAEFAIPLETLNFDPEAEAWGLNIQRNIRRKGEIVRWASAIQSRVFIHLLDAGNLEGMVGLRQGLGIDVIPGATVRFRDDWTNPGRDHFGFDPTLDIFYKPTPSVTGVLTVNTDFGEAEVDAFQVNLERFPLFFPEKRNFFLQDVGIFNFGGLVGANNGRPFFSRKVALGSNGEALDLIAGAKATGRVGPVSFGIFDAQVGDYSVGGDHVQSKNLGVARMTVDVFEESRIGAIVTNGDPSSDDNNTLIGVDSQFGTSRLFGDRQLLQRLWIQRSESTGVHKQQMAWGAALSYPNDAVNWAAEYRELQENFNPALGRAPRTGTRSYSANLRLRHRPPVTSPIRFVEGRVLGNMFTDRHDRLQTRHGELLVAAENRPGDRIELRYTHRFDRVGVLGFPIANGVTIPRGGYNFGGGTLILTSSPTRRISGRLVVAGGTFYDGHRYDVIPSLVVRPNKHWRLSLAMREIEVRLPQGDFAVRTASARLAWQFDPDISWSTLVQWQSTTDRIGIQSRLAWIIVPGREFFLVLTQDLVNVDREVQRGQTLSLAKIGWTLRY